MGWIARLKTRWGFYPDDNFWERIDYDRYWLRRSPAFYSPWRHAWFINGSRCGLCGRLQCDFHAPDDVWLRVNKLRGRLTNGGVLCANCYLLICQYGKISAHKIETLG